MFLQGRIICAGMDTFSGSPLQPPNYVLTLEKAEELFQPYKALLAECIQLGWDAWHSFYKPKHHILRSRSRATIVYDEIVSYVGQKFSGLPEVVFKSFRSSFLLYIGDSITVRFKKFNKYGRCSNIRTHQQYLFGLQMEIPGMKTGTMFQAGYVLDELQQNIVKKAIVCEFGNRVLYSIELFANVNAAIQIASIPVTAPTKTGRFEVKPEAVPESEKEKKRKRKGD
jgi:hypothetical protein